MTSHPPAHSRYGFIVKLGAAVLLVALGDGLVWRGAFTGPAFGIFALAWTVLTVAAAPALRRDRRALAAAAAALLAALLLIEDPGLLAWALFASALAMAALLPRTARFDDAWAWAQRLVLLGLTSPIGPWRDAVRSWRRRRTAAQVPLSRLVPLLALPIGGSLVFVTLFASANPLIGDTLGALRLPDLDIPRLLTWAFLLTTVWTTLRPRRIRPALGLGSGSTRPLPGVSVASVTLSLLLFNALFAVANGLDLAFLWSGAPLPGDMKMKDYVHRGAYPLIATALLAGLFVLVTLRPGSETAARPLIRRLVLLWTLQNVLLVASSVLRTLDYIDAYLLTELRIAALAWMGLVATGLVLICWRMLTGRSAAWLVNTNAAAALAVLAAGSVVDLGAVAARWNVEHSREAGGRGQPLDLCYMGNLGSSALVPLTELAQRTPHNVFGDRVRAVRETVLHRTRGGQQGGSWSWRDARRLEAVEAVRGIEPLSPPANSWRDCQGRLQTDTLPTVTPVPRVLTPEPPR